MPQVPFVSQPRVGPAPLPGARVSPNAPAAAFRGGIQNAPDLSGVVNVAQNEQQARHKIALEEAYQADQVAVTHATSATQNGVNDFLHGPDGLLNKRGQNAFTIDQDAYDQYGKLVADVRANLGNDRQRAVYDKYVMNGWDAVQSQVVPHIAREREAFDKEGVQTALDANLNAVIANPENPVVVEHSVIASRAIATERAKRLGLGDEGAKAVGDDAVSNIHMAAIKSMLMSPTNPNRDRMASAYYDAKKEELVGKDRLDAERLTKSAAIEGDALRTTDKIIATAGTESKAYDEAAKIEDPVLREKVEARISLVYNRRAGAIQQDQKDAHEQGFAILQKHGGDLSAVPIPLREKMGSAYYQNLESESYRLLYTRNPGDPEQYQSLVNMATFQPDAFNQVNLPSLKGLNTSQVNQLQTLQRTTVNRDVRQSEADLTRDLTGVKSDERRYRRLAEKAEADGDKDAQARYERMQEDANQQATLIQSELVAVKQKAKGTPVTPPPTAPASPKVAPAKLQPPTDAMAVDIARAKASGERGKAYLDLLRSHGIDVDATPAAEPPKPSGPVVDETTFSRDPKTGQVTTIKRTRKTPQ